MKCMLPRELLSNFCQNIMVCKSGFNISSLDSLLRPFLDDFFTGENLYLHIHIGSIEVPVCLQGL